MPKNNSVEVHAKLQPVHLDPEHRLRPILTAALNRRPAKTNTGAVPTWKFWKPEHFSLHKVSIFKKSSEAVQRKILAACSERLLEEGYFIEKMGISFTAKMTLLSETTEERMLYSLFASDEASHLNQIAAFLPRDPGTFHANNPFLELLAETIENGSRPSLTYLIQVVLEGWGISHYQSIAHDCQLEGLSQSLKQIVKDEALHHGSGVVLFNDQDISGSDHRFILEILVRLFQMVQAGPQQVVAAIEIEKGSLSHQQRVEVFEELDCQAQTRPRLGLLRALMSSGNADPLMRDLDRYNVFRPWTSEECASGRAAELTAC